MFRSYLLVVANDHAGKPTPKRLCQHMAQALKVNIWLKLIKQHMAQVKTTYGIESGQS